MSAAPKIFLTGDPGCGKTTAIRRVVERLSEPPGLSMKGFWTEEVTRDGRRHGFRGVTLDGRTFALASVDRAGDFRVGPYGVVLDELEAVGVPSLVPDSETRLIVIDEVGKMESFSEPFRQQVEALLDGPVPVLGTVAAHGVGFVKRVRQDGRVTLVRMSRRSREATPGEILRRLDLAPQPRTALSSPRR